MDQQRQVRIGARKNSYWHLRVDQAGEHEIELCRWPRESGLALTEACQLTVATDGEFPAGESLHIARARLFIDGKMHTKMHTRDMEPGCKGVVFKLHRDARPSLLHTWFDDEGNVTSQ